MNSGQASEKSKGTFDSILNSLWSNQQTIERDTSICRRERNEKPSSGEDFGSIHSLIITVCN